MNPEPTTGNLSIGIDFGGTSVKLGVCQGDELLVTDEPIPTSNFSGPAALIGEMAARVAKLREKYPAICAIGVGVPGLVDFYHGFVHEPTNVPGWKHVPLKTILGEKTGLSVVVDNDANAMTYAEFRYGAARGLKNVVGLTIGTGIGGIGTIMDQADALRERGPDRVSPFLVPMMISDSAADIHTTLPW